jgi:hypothetical protein
MQSDIGAPAKLDHFLRDHRTADVCHLDPLLTMYLT